MNFHGVAIPGTFRYFASDPGDGTTILDEDLLPIPAHAGDWSFTPAGTPTLNVLGQSVNLAFTISHHTVYADRSANAPVTKGADGNPESTTFAAGSFDLNLWGDKVTFAGVFAAGFQGSFEAEWDHNTSGSGEHARGAVQPPLRLPATGNDHGCAR